MRKNNYWNPPEIGEKKENEVEVYTVSIGNLTLNPLLTRKQKEILKEIQEMNGFVGIYPCYPKGTLCLFKTENDAKGARNLIRAKGIETGKNIGTCYVDKSYVK